MASVELDLRRLATSEAPRPADVAAAGTADSVRVPGPVSGLAAVLTALLKADRSAEAPVAGDPWADPAATALAADLGIGTGAPRSRTLVRDDHGGVLLHYGR